MPRVRPRTPLVLAAWSCCLALASCEPEGGPWHPELTHRPGLDGYEDMGAGKIRLRISEGGQAVFGIIRR